MLPHLLENQRQQLERMSAFERNQALNRIAAANEESARALNTAAAAAYYNSLRGPGAPNTTLYGPYGIGITPAVPGVPGTTVNPAAVYNSLLPVGGLSLP
jgi:hypothetical protein